MTDLITLDLLMAALNHLELARQAEDSWWLRLAAWSIRKHIDNLQEKQCPW